MIKTQKPIVFINDCGALVDYDELAKAAIWYAKSPIARIKHIFMHGKYPAISVKREKIHIHRLLMMYWIGTNLPSEYYVHHIDNNKLNAQKKNLSLVLSSFHQSYHNKGKTISDKQKAAIVAFNHSQKGKRRKHKSAVTSAQVYELKSRGYSFNRISHELGLDWGCVKQRYDDFIHDNPEPMKRASGENIENAAQDMITPAT